MIRSRQPIPAARLAVAALLLLSPLAPRAAAQQSNPVYPDDSAVARDTLARARENLASGNEPEAVRELQRLLDDQPDRVVATGGESSVLYASVRARVHETLLSSPALLERYRAAVSARGQQLLDSGDAAAAERAYLLTPAGFEAALRIAQLQIEGANFEAARLTLQQLESHPDRAGKPGADAAALARTLCAYLDRQDVRDWAARWTQQAGAPLQPPAPVALPPALAQRRVDFTSPAPRLQSEELPDRPLWSLPLAPEQVPADPADAQTEFDASIFLNGLWVLPTVVGDTVYVNDGTFVTARDRFTLQPRWSVRPVGLGLGEDAYAARRNRTAIEDVATVSVSGRTLVCTMGAAGNGVREGDPGTYGIDASTGRILWSAYLPAMDAQLEDAIVRGPALIDGDTVVLAMRKSQGARRMVSAYLVGLRLEDGAMKWVRPLGSAGAMAWNQRSDTRCSGTTLHEGIVYTSDNLGVIAAVEAATGRPVWVRRSEVPASVPGIGGEYIRAWQFSPPVVEGGAVFVLSPDRQGLVQLDARTGKMTGRKTASAVGNPFYLVRLGPWLGAVGFDSIVFCPVNDLAKGAAFRSRPFAPQIFGRVVISGDRALVPLYDGAALVDPAHADAEPQKIRLERPGNVLPLESELLTIDVDTLHTYLTWSVAHELLDTRMREDPSDPEPAITYAELAYRAQHHDGIAPALDKAIAALDRAGATESAAASRARLFAVIRDMVEYTQARAAGGDAPGASPEPATDDSRRPRRRLSVASAALSRPSSPRPVLDLPHLALVIERMGRAAQTGDDQVSHLVALGRLREAEGRAPLAAEAYQRILAEPALAAAAWRSPSGSVRAELEAARRIRQLLLDRGPEAYAAFDAQAARELDALGPAAGTAELEKFARQYPAAVASATAWLRAADQLGQRPREALADLREALVTAETTSGAGSLRDASVLSEAAGRLLTGLSNSDQEFTASQLLARLRKQYPNLALLDHGVPLAPEALAADLVKRLASQERFPRIGPQITEVAQTLPGWVVMVPQNRDHPGRPCEHLLMISRADTKLALWGFGGGQGIGSGGAGAGQASQLQQLWTRSYQGQPPILLRTEPGAIYLWWERTEASQGPVIEKISAVAGETLWKTDPLRSLFPADPELERRRQVLRNTVSTPIDGAVRLWDVVVAIDDKAVVMSERSGRVAAFENASGKLLWAVTAPLGQVNDIAAGNGMVFLGGTPAPEGDNLMASDQLGVVLAYDTLSGVLLRRFAENHGQVRWLRLAPGQEQKPSVIVAFNAEVGAFDPATGNQNWSVAGNAAFSSADAWVYADRLYLLDSNREMWQIDTGRGQMLEPALDTRARLATQEAIQGNLLPTGNVAFSTDRGVCIFNPAGKLAGLDAFGNDATDQGFLPAAVGSAHMALVESYPREAANDRVIYNIHLLDTATAMLRSTRTVQLEMPPRRVAAVDGYIVITAGNVTVVYSAPEQAPPALGAKPALR